MDEKILKNLTDGVENLKVEKSSDELLSRLAHYREKSETLADRVRALLADRGRFETLVEDLKKSVVAADPYERFQYKFSSSHSSPISPVAMVSDWQTGEVVAADEVDGFGGFNWETQQKYVETYTRKIIDWANMHREAGFPINEMHVFSLSDHVSGNIHYELETTNEFPVTIATANAVTLLGEMLLRLAGHFDKLVVWEESADNHGRLTRKNQWKQGAKNNWSWLVHVIANSYIRKADNIDVRMAAGTKQLAAVQGKRFLLSHGHSVQMYMSIPYYGLERERGREAIKRMNTGKEFDYICIGHFHVPAFVSGNIIINGNLPGTTEFDHSQGRYSPPSQVSFMVHPKYGMFDFTPWILNK